MISQYDETKWNSMEIRIQYLLLIFSLRSEPSLDALPGFEEGLPLSQFSGMVRQHACHIRSAYHHDRAQQLEHTIPYEFIVYNVTISQNTRSIVTIIDQIIEKTFEWT